ncbi:hypothetical protein LX36DRAFT_301412 [Colletotrichum falcatum]|nr:hypothetical protein LX36DRAFT_301412 [Colletotrichum falcatum]
MQNCCLPRRFDRIYRVTSPPSPHHRQVPCSRRQKNAPLRGGSLALITQQSPDTGQRPALFKEATRGNLAAHASDLAPLHVGSPFSEQQQARARRGGRRGAHPHLVCGRQHTLPRRRFVEATSQPAPCVCARARVCVLVYRGWQGGRQAATKHQQTTSSASDKALRDQPVRPAKFATIPTSHLVLGASPPADTANASPDYHRDIVDKCPLSYPG